MFYLVAAQVKGMSNDFSPLDARITIYWFGNVYLDFMESLTQKGLAFEVVNKLVIYLGITMQSSRCDASADVFYIIHIY